MSAATFDTSEWQESLRDVGDVSKLVPELRRYVKVTSRGIQILQHPLVQQIFAVVPHQANAMLVQKEKQLAAALEDKDYDHALWLYERPWRLHMLATWRWANMINVEQLRVLLAQVWIDAENPNVIKATVLPLFNEARRAGLVTDLDTQESIDALLDGPELALYRGVHHVRHARGMSWTRNPERAAWFAKRFRPKSGGVVVSTIMPPDKFLGVFIGRGEDEVVLNPRQIKTFKIEEGV